MIDEPCLPWGQEEAATVYAVFHFIDEALEDKNSLLKVT